MSILSFQMPEKVVVGRTDDFVGLFEFKPLEPGYGVTIGNALRRVLLSSLEGYAIKAVRIPGVLHEFSSIEGVVQDMVEIILNLKKVRFKRIGEENEEQITLKIKGKSVFKAAEISQVSANFKVLNEDLVICELDPSKELTVNLVITKGRGYVPAEEQEMDEHSLDFIAIDSIFTPIRNVKYQVENTRVEQKTDYEKLLLEVETDGSINPEDALKSAAHILIQHFMLFSDQTMTFELVQEEETAVVDEEILRMRKLLKTPLSELDLSVRAYNCLRSANIKTLGDLVRLEITDMMKFRNFGKKSLTEIEELISSKGLTFGMDVTKYRLDEE